VHVLLDENLPLDLAAEIPGHDVQTVRSRGWTGIENGELFGVIIMHAPSNRLVHLRPLVGALLHAIESVNPGELQRVGV
jgi:hypothetical protein